MHGPRGTAGQGSAEHGVESSARVVTRRIAPNGAAHKTAYTLYCSPHVRDGKGRPADFRYDMGTDESQYALGLGQVAMVSHWMLRAKDARAKAAGTWNNNQVAFVEPGKHRVYCDMSASWGSKGGWRLMLRTGEAAFNVTGEDVGTN